MELSIWGEKLKFNIKLWTNSGYKFKQINGDVLFTLNAKITFSIQEFDLL